MNLKRKLNWVYFPYFSSTLLGTLALFLFFGAVLLTKPVIFKEPEIYIEAPIEVLIVCPPNLISPDTGSTVTSLPVLTWDCCEGVEGSLAWDCSRAVEGYRVRVVALADPSAEAWHSSPLSKNTTSFSLTNSLLPGPYGWYAGSCSEESCDLDNISWSTGWQFIYSPSSSPDPAPSIGPLVCNSRCAPHDDQCPDLYECTTISGPDLGNIDFLCRNSDCPDKEDCVCPLPSPSPSPSPSPEDCIEEGGIGCCLSFPLPTPLPCVPEGFERLEGECCNSSYRYESSHYVYSEDGGKTCIGGLGFVCINCGDGNCGLSENYCNCPQDCGEEEEGPHPTPLPYPSVSSCPYTCCASGDVCHEGIFHPETQYFCGPDEGRNCHAWNGWQWNCDRCCNGTCGATQMEQDEQGDDSLKGLEHLYN